MKIQLNHSVILTFGKDPISFLYIKNDKQLVNNYRPISLLPIFGKMFEKIIFNKIYNFFLVDKISHEGLLYKLKSMGISGEICKLLENYLLGRFQRVVINEQTSSWRSILAGVPQGSILGPLLFLVYINHLPNGLKSNAKLFADDTSLFTIVKDKNKSANILNDDLQLISNWAYKWKMLFNPDPKKPAQEVLFSGKSQIQNHPTLSLNNIKVERSTYHKHLGVILYKKFNFKEHINSAISKVKKGISVIKNDIIYDQPHNKSFCEKLESIQYKAALAITGAIQRTSRDKIYEELGLESLKARR